MKKKKTQKRGEALLACAFFLFLGRNASGSDPGGDAATSLLAAESTNAGQTALQSLSPPDAATSAIRNFIDSHNTFALDFFHSIAAENTSNFTITPFSLSQLLGMLALGACGETAAQMSASLPYTIGQERRADRVRISSAALLGAEQQTDPTARVNSNKVWAHEGYILLPDYLNAQKNKFNADFERLHFTNLGDAYGPMVRAWTKNATIDLLESSGPWTRSPDKIRVLLANGFARKDALQTPFEESSSFRGLFEDLDGRQFWAPMVRRTGNYRMVENEMLTAVELPMADAAMSLMLFLPKKGYYAEVEQNIAELYARVPEMLETRTHELVLPQFSVWTSADSGLRSALEKKGMTDCFDKSKADFCHINGLGFSYTDKISHTSSINFDGRNILTAATSFSLNLATPDEPASVWGNYGCEMSMGHACWGKYMYLKAGPSETLPFLFILRNTRLNAIVSVGRLKNVWGEEAGHWECVNNMNHLGNINNDYVIDQEDVVLALQVMTGMKPATNPLTRLSVNDDKKIGLQDALHSLQSMSLFKPSVMSESLPGAEESHFGVFGGGFFPGSYTVSYPAKNDDFLLPFSTGTGQ